MTDWPVTDGHWLAVIAGGLMSLEPRAWLAGLALTTVLGIAGGALLGLDQARQDLRAAREAGD